MDILFVSLGCDKNLADTEMMLGILQKRGFGFTDDEEKADICIVNTCCFIGDAKEESIETLLEMAQLRKEGRIKALIATGCLAQRYREEIRREIPEVDALVGTSAIEEIGDAVEEALSGRGQDHYRPLDGPPAACVDRIVTTGGHYAYLKIAEGCDKHCTYCIIPKIRGNYRSVPMEQLVREAEELAGQGVKELILVAQETTLYGMDLYGEKSLHRLLDELNAISGLLWIRILYCYPEEIYEELIEAMLRNEKVCHYLDMPIQHINDTILKRMGRRTNRAELTEKIARLRAEIPDITLRTTVICGFPGETQKQHEELLQFVDEMEFDRLGAFVYSQEEGTPAAEFPDQISDEQKEARRAEVMELQEAVSSEKNEEMTGRELTVFVEGRVSGEDAYIGRTYRDAPDVDGYIFFRTQEELMTGDIVEVRVTGAYGYDLIGELKESAGGLI